MFKFAFGRAIINNIESRNFERHLEVDCDVFLMALMFLDSSEVVFMVISQNRNLNFCPTS